VPRAADDVVVDEAGRLHERVADRRPDELEAACGQRFRQRQRFRACGRNVRKVASPALPRHAVDERPDERREAADIRLYFQHGLGIGDHALDLAAMADDGRIADQGVDVTLRKAGHASRLEIRKRIPVAVALGEDRSP